MKEEWRPIKGYEGLYEVSNLGKVKSLEKVVNSRYGKRLNSERILKCTLDNGYLKISLYKNGKFKQIRLHRLLAETFIPNPENKPNINHLNGIRNDCCIENLEWCTQSENVQHAYDTGLQISQKGSQHGLHKITESEVYRIRFIGKYCNQSNEYFKSVAKSLNVSYSTVRSILKNRTWKHVTV